MDASPEPTDPTLALIFNEPTGPRQVVEIIGQKHAFFGFEGWVTRDEEGREAWLLLVWCETGTVQELLELVEGRLPDYMRARRFPAARVEQARREGTPIG